MLVLPFFSILALAPLTQGLFDFPLQTAFQAALVLPCLLWGLRALRGATVPSVLFSRTSAVVCAVAALSFCSMLASPVRPLIWPEWGNAAVGLLIFVFSGFLSAEDREKTALALRLGAWGTVVICAVQVFVTKDPEGVSGSLINPNALAFFAVMTLPWALSRKDWGLALALSLPLLLTRSAGAAVALSAAAGLYAWNSLAGEKAWKRLSLLVLFAAVLSLANSLLQPQSIINRLFWWKSAFLMFADRPLLGFGHAAFTFIYPAYSALAPRAMHTIYAHNYYLEFMAENGVVCAALWFCLLAYAVKKKTGIAKYSLVAALAHSVIDFGLSVPANFWVFCYLAAPENKGGLSIPLRVSRAANLLFPAAAAVMAAAWINLSVDHNRALRESSRAVLCYSKGALEESKSGFKKALEIENGSGTLEALGKIDYRLGLERQDRGLLFSSAVFFERALLLNPYSASAYRDLAAVYRAAGENSLLAGLQERKSKVFR